MSPPRFVIPLSQSLPGSTTTLKYSGRILAFRNLHSVAAEPLLHRNSHRFKDEVSRTNHVDFRERAG